MDFPPPFVRAGNRERKSGPPQAARFCVRFSYSPGPTMAVSKKNPTSGTLLASSPSKLSS